jgi:hypothetical protein
MASGLGSYNAANLGRDLVAQAAALSLTPSVVSVYGYTGGPSTTQSVLVSSGAAGAPYTVRSSAAWLQAAAGTVGQGLTWSVHPAGLSPGTYTGTITVSGPGSSAILHVTYAVTPPATMAVTPGAIAFSEVAVGTNGQETPPGCTNTIWRDELAGAVGGTVPTRSAEAPSLATLQIANSGPSGSVLHWSAVLVNVTGAWLSQDLEPPGAVIQQSATAPIVSTQGAQAAGTSGALDLAALANANVLSGEAGLNQGTYHGTVLIYDLADPLTQLKVPVTLVLGNGTHTPTMTATPASLSDSLPSGQRSTTSVALTDAAKTCGYQYSASSSVPWAIVDPASAIGAVSAGATASSALPLDIDASGMSPGTYHGTVTIQSANAEPDPVVVPITLTVT